MFSIFHFLFWRHSHDFRVQFLAMVTINDTTCFQWLKLPQLVQERIYSYLSDEEKLEMVDTLPGIGSQIRTFVFDYDHPDLLPSPQRLELFRRCPNVSKLIVRLKPPFDDEWQYVSLMKNVASINSGLTSIQFEDNGLKGPSNVAINCYDSKLSYLRLDYIEAILDEDPFYNGKQFTDPVLLGNRVREVESMYQSVSINKRILFLKNEDYGKFPDDLFNSVTEIDAGFNHGNDLMALIARCPRLRKIELLLGESVDDYSQS